MQSQPYELFRLRKGSCILGYQRYIKPGLAYFSKDQLWWQSQKINFQKKDAYLDLKDKNRRYLFEQDMVSLEKSSSKASDLWVLVFHAKFARYTAIHCQHYEEIDLNNIQTHGVFLQSYLFINPDIQQALFNRGLLLQDDIC